MADNRKNVISLQTKFQNMDVHIKFRNIMTQLTQVVYKKNYSTGVNGCLGEGASINLASIRKFTGQKDNLRIIVKFQRDVWDEGSLQPKAVHRNEKQDRRRTNGKDDFISIKKHLKTKDVELEMELID